MIPHVNDTKDVIEEDELAFAVENTKHLRWYDRILLNRPLKVIIPFIIVAIITPVLVYRYVFVSSLDLPPSDGFSFGSCLVARESRIPCGIPSVTPEECHAQCCYDHHNNICFHRYPSRFSYVFQGNWSEDVALNPRIPTVPFALQRSLTNIRLSIDEVSATHLTLTFYNSDRILTGRRIEQKNYTYSVSGEELNVIVNGTQGHIFNTARGPLIASENIWEISFQLTNESMYGLGEIPLKGDIVKMIYSHKGGLNSIPLIYAKSNGSYHGLLIETINPTEVMVKTDNHIVVRSITDSGLKFHLFVGPKPVDVMKDVTVALGVKRNLEYWMLGTHICRENTTSDPQAELQAFINTARTQRLPFDSHCGTAPVVFNTECNTTLVDLINEGATQIKNAGKKFVPHVSPYIKYKEIPGPENDEPETTTNGELEETEKKTTINKRRIKRETNKMETSKEETKDRCFDDEKFEIYNIRDPKSKELYKGVVDKHDVIYPTYENVNDEFMQELWAYNTDFDGVVLENNWPLDESVREFETINKFLPYFNENFEAAFNSTPQWNASRPIFNNTRQSSETNVPGERYLFTHNEYGNHFVTAFEKIKGPIPITATNQWMNGNITINRQSVPTSWSSLQKELIEASLGGVSGHWHWSSPICGDTEHFNNGTQIRLCAKWYMAATYMPMIKIHSKTIPRDPLAFVGTDRTHMITALSRRMSLLPYFYSVLQEGPLLRPMFYQYPSSNNLTDLTNQFAVGDDLLIVPNLQPGQTHVHVWMPPGTWYEFWSGLKIDGEEGEVVTMTTTEADFLTLIRGGSIIVLQKDFELTADLTRQQSAYSLVIALQCETEDIDVTSTTETSITTEGGDFIPFNRETDNGDEENDEEEPTTTEGEIKTTTEATHQTIKTCNATGKLYMNENMTIHFEANAATLNITASSEEEEHFEVFCNTEEATWYRIITEMTIYGLDTDKNNYDDFRHVRRSLDLCELKTNSEIVFKFGDDAYDN